MIILHNSSKTSNLLHYNSEKENKIQNLICSLIIQTNLILQIQNNNNNLNILLNHHNTP